MPRSGGKLEFEPILIADFEDWIALNSSKIIDKKRQGTSHFGKIRKKGSSHLIIKAIQKRSSY
jgi:hypothetical protein